MPSLASMNVTDKKSRRELPADVRRVHSIRIVVWVIREYHGEPVVIVIVSSRHQNANHRLDAWVRSTPPVGSNACGAVV